MKRKYKFPYDEIAYVLANILGAIGITLQVKANLGISMVAAPAYLLSLKIPWLTFGLAELFIQGLLFLLCCFLTKKLVYTRLLSFIAVIPYSWILDFVMKKLEWIHSTHFIGQIAIFLLGSVILALAIALFFRSYLPCQVYEMFVKCIAEHFSLDVVKVKLIYDWSSFAIAIIMSVLFFHRIQGIGLGTLLCTGINAPLIHFWGTRLDNTCLLLKQKVNH